MSMRIGESSSTKTSNPLDQISEVCSGICCATGISRLRENFKTLTGQIVKRIRSVVCKETKQERSERFLTQIPGKIETELKLTLEVGDNSVDFKSTKFVAFKSTCTPHKTRIDGNKEVWFSSDRGSEGHISNLWRHDIEVDGKKISFIRSASTRGNEQATKELLINALGLQRNLRNGDLILNLSNVQLMTPVGKVGDGDIPLKQMRMLQELAGEQQSIEIEYNGTTFNVKLNTPLLFNFGVNLQHFRMGRLAHSPEIDAINQKSFKSLFGDDPKKLEEPYNFGGIIGKFLKDCEDASKKKQIQALVEQIVSIMKKHPDGIEANPYALPVRVMLLTNLLGYATTYGCKSGKDRTGVCAMELEALAAKLLSTDKSYDPENPSDEEKALLSKLYLKGEATKIAGANTGQKGLKIQEFLGFKSLRERFGVKLAKDPLVNALEELDKKVVKDLRNAISIGVLLEKAKKKPEDLTEEDKKAIQDASAELDKISRDEKTFPKEYRDLISRIIDPAKRFSPTLFDEHKREVDALKKQGEYVTNLGNIRLQVAILLEKTKKKPKELTEEDKKAVASASLELARIARMEGLSERYSDLINSIIDSSQGFSLESPEGSPPKKVTPQTEESPKEQLGDESSPESPKSSQPKGSLKPSQFLVTQKMLQSVKLKPLDRA